MAWYEPAVKKEINKANKFGKRKLTNAVILHIDAGGSDSLFGYWNSASSGSNGCHFYVTYEGVIEQYADTDMITYTSAAGSLRSIGIETQGKDDGSDWTEAQIIALVKLVSWLCDLYNIPKVDMMNSLPTSVGVGIHRYGINPWRVVGGELWSSANAKTCPGDERVKQFPGIVLLIQGELKIEQPVVIIPEIKPQPERPVMSKMVNPTRGRVTSEFSTSRKHPVTGKVQPHYGIDIALAGDVDIVAAFAGKVIAAGWQPVGGRTGYGILIENPDGEKQYYGHLRKSLGVVRGQTVKAGHYLGKQGATGNVTGQHLHFETWNTQGKPFSPRTLFNKYGIEPGVNSTAPSPAPQPAPGPHKPEPGFSQGIKNIQEALVKTGHYKGLTDGLKGHMTLQAIKDYQAGQKAGNLLSDGDWGSKTQEHFEFTKRIQGYLGLVVDGDYGNVTFEAVKKYQSNQKFPKLLADGQWGDKTEAHYVWTRKLQSKLALVIDGDYGNLTLEAVKTFQRRNKLFVDGEAGPKTCAKLGIRIHP